MYQNFPSVLNDPLIVIEWFLKKKNKNKNWKTKVGTWNRERNQKKFKGKNFQKYSKGMNFSDT